MTPRGYLLSEAVSALIKSLRLADEESALYWGLEIGQTYGNYVWKRLSIFCAEDIGLKDPMAICTVSALWASYDRIRQLQGKAREVEPDLLVMGILTCARAVNSREVDTAKCWALERRARGWKLEIPPHALDCHTAAGRRAGKLEVDWWRAADDYLPIDGFGKWEAYARSKQRGEELPAEGDVER
jgi:replication-associated recombination protein RarA